MLHSWLLDWMFASLPSSKTNTNIVSDYTAELLQKTYEAANCLLFAQLH